MRRRHASFLTLSVSVVGSKLRRPTWIPTETISVLFQGGTNLNPELADAPMMSADRSSRAARTPAACKAVSSSQISRVGDQTGTRVFLCL